MAGREVDVEAAAAGEAAPEGEGEGGGGDGAVGGAVGDMGDASNDYVASEVAVSIAGLSLTLYTHAQHRLASLLLAPLHAVRPPRL